MSSSHFPTTINHPLNIIMRRRSRRLKSPRFFSTSCSSMLFYYYASLLLLVAIIGPALLLPHHHSGGAAVQAKEMEATHEWTLVGENDTVAAGMHIRMDLETGQKWVKLLSTEEEDNHGSPDHVKASASSSSSSSRQGQSTTSSAVVVTVDGEASTTTTATTGDEDSPKYDYDMMHRTLNQLPDEEKIRIGLPEAPSNPKTMAPSERKLFEERMLQIWKVRQQELQQFQEQFVADLPKILQDRIERLRQYVNDPVHELDQLDLTASDNNGEDESSGPVVTHIVSVLADLEYHLSDIDMTRDFYTLGGWPLLVTLLRDDTHHPAAQNSTTAARTYSDDAESQQLSRASKIHVVQAHAAWALGTAVKNTGEFAPFVVEPIPTPNKSPPQSQSQSALQVLIDQLSKVDVYDASRHNQDKIHKYLYALGSFVRGNPMAQQQFVAPDATATATATATLALGRLLEAHVQLPTGASSVSSASRKIVHRVVALVDDLIRETKDASRPTHLAHVADQLVQQLSTPAWCESSLVVLERSTALPSKEDVHPQVQSVVPSLRILRAIAPHCPTVAPQWPGRARSTTSTLVQQWQEYVTALGQKAAQKADADPSSTDDGLEDLQEGIDLAQSVLAVLEGQ